MNILKALFLVVAGGATLLGVELSEHTHSPRWNVKTLADSLIVAESPVPTTIDEQYALPMPDVGESVKRLPSERTLYSLEGRLVEVKKEFDGDYHLVIQDPKTELKIVAEIPDGSSKAPEQYKSDFAEARKMIDQLVGKPGMLGIKPKVPPRIEVTGLGFFDEPHMFTPEGMAPNCREIHPVLKVRALS